MQGVWKGGNSARDDIWDDVKVEVLGGAVGREEWEKLGERVDLVRGVVCGVEGEGSGGED